MLPRFHAITFGPDTLPSVRHRFLSYREALAPYLSVSWGTSFSAPEVTSLEEGDVLFVQKRLPPAIWTWFVARRIRASIIFDFDDAIWTPPKATWSASTRWRTSARFTAIVRRADRVFAANRYLSNYAKGIGGNTTHIPMSVSLPSEILPPRHNPKVLIFGWNGHPQSHYLIESISNELRDFFSGNTGAARLKVLSGRRPNLGFDFDWVNWSPEAEREYFSEVDVGLAPSTNSPFDMGKSPIKILQHFAHGRTVVTNGLGATREFGTEGCGYVVDGKGGWGEALERVLSRPEERCERGLSGRRLIETEYSYEHVSRRFVSEVLSVARR